MEGFVHDSKRRNCWGGDDDDTHRHTLHILQRLYTGMLINLLLQVLMLGIWALQYFFPSPGANCPHQRQTTATCSPSFTLVCMSTCLTFFCCVSNIFYCAEICFSLLICIEQLSAYCEVLVFSPSLLVVEGPFLFSLTM